MNNFIYLDNAATTKPLPQAIDYALKYLNEEFFNPSSLYHGGVACKSAISSAKSEISKLFGTNFDIIFTSCGSESDNMVINSYKARGNIVSTLGEHSAIHNTLTEFGKQGSSVKMASLNKNGSVNIENLLSLIDENTVLVSVVHVNNETGAINDINEIAKLCKSKNPRIVFHSDGVQAFMKIPYKISPDVDLYSISAHKINGIKGVGAIVKNKRLNTLKPLIYGGGQENGFRSGTENVFGIKNFEYCCISHKKTLIEDYKYAKTLQNYVFENLDKSIFTLITDGNSSPYIITASAKGLRGEVLQHKLEQDGIIVGTGSACSSKHKHSRMLQDIGYLDDVLDGVIRISLSNQTTSEEITYAVEKINQRAKELKRTMLV